MKHNLQITITVHAYEGLPLYLLDRSYVGAVSRNLIHLQRYTRRSMALVR